MKKFIVLCAVVAIALTGCGPTSSTPPAPVVKAPANLVVYVGFRITNYNAEAIGGRAHVVVDAKDSNGKALGPDHIDTQIRNDDPKPAFGATNYDGSWAYPIGIGPGAGAVTISITAEYLADPEEILICFIARDPQGNSTYDDDIKQADFRTLLTTSCGAVVSN